MTIVSGSAHSTNDLRRCWLATKRLRRWPADPTFILVRRSARQPDIPARPGGVWHHREVPRFEPFAALRYAPSVPLADVTAPPYDVLSDADRAALAARHPQNVVKVDVPVESDGPGRYTAAGARMARWIDHGVIVADDAPCFYRYTMDFLDEAGARHRTVGVFGGLEVRAAGTGEVLPHEQTTPKAKTDRLDLTRATGTNLSAVWGLSLASGIGAIMAELPATLLGAFTDDQGVGHTIEQIADAHSIEIIQTAIEASPVVIADGHHRYEIARVFRAERQAAGFAAGPHDLTLTFVVELAPEHLFVQAIHRLLSELPVDIDLVRLLNTFFVCSPAGDVSAETLGEMTRLGALCLVHPDGTGTYLVPRPDAFAGERDLDTARLEHALAATPHTKAYQHGVEHITEAVTSGRAQYGVLLRPVPIAEIERTAHEGLLMPPKSTFFAPKPKTGLIFRRVADATA
jgi:uncharacterized protein (DUF1015 family)